MFPVCNAQKDALTRVAGEREKRRFAQVTDEPKGHNFLHGSFCLSNRTISHNCVDDRGRRNGLYWSRGNSHLKSHGTTNEKGRPQENSIIATIRDVRYFPIKLRRKCNAINRNSQKVDCRQISRSMAAASQYKRTSWDEHDVPTITWTASITAYLPLAFPGHRCTDEGSGKPCST